MARLSREIIISEKIDGTNASIFIQDILLEENAKDPNILLYKTIDGKALTIRAGSRTKWITPQNDNYGFAKWVLNNSDELFKLGEGHHFGEWWGKGIQRGYNMKEKQFSLFNVARWGEFGTEIKPACCGVVPVLYRGVFDTVNIDAALVDLKLSGSFAAPGFNNPEGIVVWHTAANIGFKKTIKDDDKPKSLVK